MKYRLCQFWYHSAQQPIISDSFGAFSQLLQFQFSVGPASGAIFGHATFLIFKNWEKFQEWNIELELIAIDITLWNNDFL